MVNLILFKIIILDINNDSVFTKIGFPKNLNQLIGKSQELFLSKFN
jgi:hypothetical protein